MSQTPPPAAPPPRSAAASVFMTLPLLFGGALLLAMAGLMYLSWRGGSAGGERIGIHLQGECAEAALPTIKARIDAMGLGDPEVSAAPGKLSAIVTLPGQDPAWERASIPALLGRPGRLALVGGDQTLATEADVESARLDLDESGMPVAVLTLKEPAAGAVSGWIEAQPQGELAVKIDGEEFTRRPNSNHLVDRELRISALSGVPQDRMRAAAEQVVLFSRAPLPCPLAVSAVVPAPAGG